MLGPYRLTRPLPPGPLGERRLALHEGDSTSHLINRIARVQTDYDRRRFSAVMTALRELRHPHILPIEAHGILPDGSGFTCSPFTGDVDGLVTLESLLRAKGGSLPPIEARTAMIQLLQAVEHAHRLGHRHGPLRLDGVQVDRRGSLAIEHYGLARLMDWFACEERELERAEVASVVEMGYRLVTGLLPDDPIIPAGRVVAHLDPLWDDWFQTGLIDARGGGPGFRSAAHALSAIESRASQQRRPPAGIAGLRAMLGSWAGRSPR